MDVLEAILGVLPAVTISWPALVGYAVAIVAMRTIRLRIKHNDDLLARIEELPGPERLRALQMEVGTVYLARGFTPEGWLMQRRQRYNVLAFFVVVGVVATLIGAAIVVGRPAAEIRTETSDPATLEEPPDASPTPPVASEALKETSDEPQSRPNSPVQRVRDGGASGTAVGR